MTDTRKDGGPAFPHDNHELGDKHRVAQPGMSLRDWFAGQALAGFMANKHHRLAFNAEDDAAFAYRIADAMIAARTVQGGGDG